MRIAILGAGPAGLYLAYLIKRRQPDADVSVFEQNAANATFGFGVGFAAIGRLKLLQLLQARAASVGVKPVFGHAVQNLDDLDRADLIVGADGVNSLVRRR